MEERTTSAQEQLYLAQAAQELLANPAVVEVFERLEREYTSHWRESALHHQDVRESAYFRLHALMALRQDIQVLISGGRIVENILRRKK